MSIASKKLPTQMTKKHPVVERFESAVQAQAFRGSQPPEEWNKIGKEYRDAKKCLLLTLKEQPFDVGDLNVIEAAIEISLRYIALSGNVLNIRQKRQSLINLKRKITNFRKP